MLSIIMASYKRGELLKQGLASIEKQKIKYNYEIIVLNDGIEDDTYSVCNSFNSLPIRYIFTGQRNKDSLKWRVPGFALNIGARQATCKLLLLTCPEIIYLTPNTLNQMIELSLLNPKHLIIPEFGFDDIEGITSKKYKEGISLNMETELVQNLNVEFPFALMMHIREFINIGGYDEDMTGYCYDDADLMRRLCQNGCGQYLSVKDSKILHLFHGKRTNRIGLENRKEALEYNLKIFNSKQNQIRRNVNKEWGKI